MKKLVFLFFFILLFLGSSWSLLHPSFFHVHDYTHGARIAEMLTSLQEGQLPVRWSANLGYGYGMPLFEFYAPLPYFVGAALLWLRLDIVEVVRLLYFISSIGTCLGAYFLGKKLFGRTGGWVTAAAYTMAPYRAVNLFVRGALSEAWAMMALPWVLLGIVLIIQKKREGFWILLVGLLTLFLSHNLTTLMFVPLSMLFALCYWVSVNWPIKNRLKSRETLVEAGKLVGSYAIAIGLSAFYLFPALAENSFTKIYQIFSGYFYYSNHFLYIRQFFNGKWGYGGSSWGPDDDMSYFLGYGQFFGLFIFGIGWISSFVRRKTSRARLFFYLSIAGMMFFAAFMTLLRSKFLWDAIPILQTIQFPWRWLSIVTLLLALLAGAGVSLVSRKQRRLYVGLILVIVIVATNVSFFQPESYLEDPHALYYTDPVRIQTEMSSVLPDYIPKTMSELTEASKVPFLVPDGTEKQVEIVINRGAEKLYKTSFSSAVQFNPQIASFPGWMVEIDGKPVEWSSKGQYGTIIFEVPSGEHMVSVYFGRTPVRAISDSISFLSIVGLFGIATYASLTADRARHR